MDNLAPLHTNHTLNAHLSPGGRTNIGLGVYAAKGPLQWAWCG